MLNQKQFLQKPISLILGVVIISLTLSFWVIAWTEPSQPPPDGNAASPLNVSETGQTKQGWLSTMESLWVGLKPASQEQGQLYAGLLRVLKGAMINENDSELGLIVAGGRVGIGTTDPAEGYRMEVNGDIKLSGETPTFTITNVASPISDSDVTTKEYVDNQCTGSGSCSYGLRFAGYTSLTFHGNLGGYKGAHQKCADAYPAWNNNINTVHWCSVNELMELGAQYPYTYTVWVGNSYKNSFNNGYLGGYWGVYGGAGATSTMFDPSLDAVPECKNWSWYNPNPPVINYEGPVVYDSTKGGRIGVESCSFSPAYRLACCYNGD